MLRLMSNRKQILRGKCEGRALLLSPTPFPLPRRNPATFSNDSLESAGRQRQRHRPLAGVEYDELSIRNAVAERPGDSAADRSIFSIL
jgi:hypothetical protein